MLKSLNLFAKFLLDLGFFICNVLFTNSGVSFIESMLHLNF